MAAQDAVDRYLANRMQEQMRASLAAQAPVNPDKPYGEAADFSGTGGYVEGGGSTAGATPPPDWSSYLGMYGLPADVQRELNAIFARTPDVQQAAQLAIAYVRGTTWYSQTYPGIQEAFAKGIVRNEAEYRQRFNDFNQVYRQYNGRDLTAGEFAGYLGEGATLDTVARRFQGAALTSAYGNDWQYAAGAFGDGRLDQNQLRTLGEQEAGLDTPGGVGLQKMIRDAQRKLSRVFEGVLATGPVAGLDQAQQRAKSPDIAR